MKITHYINRPDADDILVDVEVTIGDDDKGLTFTPEDVGTVVQPHEKYLIGDEIVLTLMEKGELVNIAADRMAALKYSAEDVVEDL